MDIWMNTNYNPKKELFAAPFRRSIPRASLHYPLQHAGLTSMLGQLLLTGTGRTNRSHKRSRYKACLDNRKHNETLIMR